MPKDVLLPKFSKKKARYRKVRYCVPKTVPKCTDFDRLSVQKIRAKKSLKSANFYRISYRIFYWQIYWQIGRNHAEEHQIRLFGTALISISRYYYLPNVKISSVQFGKNFGTRTSLSMPIFYFNNCTLVRLNSGIASVTQFLKFPIFRRIDVFRNPKIPDF